MKEEETKKIIFIVLGVVALVAAAIMYYVGSDSSHLSELKDYYWVPIPLGILLLLAAAKMK